METIATYICPSCGEAIDVFCDPTGGDEQRYIEDCPVCCRPNELHVTFDANGTPRVSAQLS